MALRAVPDHPKFAHLKSLLKLPKGAVLGWLESMWHFAGRYTPQGNIGKYTDGQIESWMEWDGEPGALIAAMVNSGWIDLDDEGSPHRLIIHDWHQHADKATRMALKRAKLPFLLPEGEEYWPPDPKNREQCGNTVPESGNSVPKTGNGVGTTSTSTSSCSSTRKTKNLSAQDKPAADSRFTPFRERFEKYFAHRNQIQPPWDGKEARHLSRWLKANPTVTEEQWHTILLHRNKSPVAHGESLSAWIGKALSWLPGPADTWGKPIAGGGNGNSANRAQQRTDANRAAAREALSELLSPDAGDGGGAWGEPEQGGPETLCGDAVPV